MGSVEKYEIEYESGRKVFVILFGVTKIIVLFGIKSIFIKERKNRKYFLKGVLY